MSVDIDMSGLDRQFRELAYRTQNGGKKAAKAGAEIVAERLKENTPYDPGTKTHMKDDIKISRPNDLGQYMVGYGKDTAWRSKFVNDGTIKQPAQHFAERTITDTKETVRATMQSIINEELNGL